MLNRPNLMPHSHTLLPDRPSNISVIEACSLFNAVTSNQRQALAERSFMAFAERGESIWRAGTPAQIAAIAGVGFVKMTRSTPQGMEVAVELLGPGQVFGLLASIEGGIFPLTATAVTNCWYLKLPADIIRTTYEESNQFKDQMVRSISPRLRKAHEMMSRMSTGKVEQRIAATLLILVQSYGTETEEGMHIEVPLTRQDISEMAGTTVETTIRVMSRWQKEGLVTTRNQNITIVNPDALSESLLH